MPGQRSKEHWRRRVWERSWEEPSAWERVNEVEEVGTDHVSDHALRFSSDVSMERMYRLSFCRNCETLHPGVGLNGKSS